MSSLLSVADKANFRAAIMLVTDTFFTTPILYRMAGESIDRFNEDRKDIEYIEYNLLGMVEWKKEKITQTVQGAIDNGDVMVSFNMENLITAGVVDNSTKMLIFNATKDYMIINGKNYKVNMINYDGPLDQQNVLVVITGDLQENNS